jgi:hypothetical protein
MKEDFVRFAFLAAVAAAWLALAASAQAQAPKVAIELNKLEAAGDACRAYLVLNNGSEIAFDSLNLDLVLFDDGGIIARRLAVETAPLPAGKLSVKAFDVADLDCAQVGRVLLNDVLACDGAPESPENCLALIETSAQGELSFVK